MKTPSDETSSPRASFEALGLSPDLLEVLTELGYEEPTPIQAAAIPLLIEGRDVLGEAATGTGKTGAFALPMVEKITPGRAGPLEAQALILVPTRELAVQVAEAVHTYGKKKGISVLPIYGGQEFSQQLRRLKRGIDVVVATPGRALDHLRRKTLKLEQVQLVVLDEADEMLDLGFAEDLDAILSEVPADVQTALFSATLPPRIAAIAERHLDSPARVKIRQEKTAAGAAPRVRQTAYLIARGQKRAALGRVLDLEAPKSAIIFCRTRTEVDELADFLEGNGFAAEAIHGGLNQQQRDRVLQRFKTGGSEILVATDVAARGLHIEKLSHVVNYDLPTAPEAYVHRIGRTGRAGAEGVAISFAEPREHRLLRNIERVTGQKIEAGRLPTVADLRARKLELLQAQVRETIVKGGLDPYRIVIEALSSEFDLVEIASAALKLSQGAEPEAPIEEIRQPEPERERPSRPARDEGRGPPSRGPRRRMDEASVRIFVGAGRKAGMRPADLVGAIANEAGLESKAIGSIQINELFSLVEVPESAGRAGARRAPEHHPPRAQGEGPLRQVVAGGARDEADEGVGDARRRRRPRRGAVREARAGDHAAAGHRPRPGGVRRRRVHRGRRRAARARGLRGDRAEPLLVRRHARAARPRPARGGDAVPRHRADGDLVRRRAPGPGDGEPPRGRAGAARGDLLGAARADAPLGPVRRDPEGGARAPLRAARRRDARSARSASASAARLRTGSAASTPRSPRSSRSTGTHRRESRSRGCARRCSGSTPSTTRGFCLGCRTSPPRCPLRASRSRATSTRGRGTRS